MASPRILKEDPSPKSIAVVMIMMMIRKDYHGDDDHESKIALVMMMRW